MNPPTFLINYLAFINSIYDDTTLFYDLKTYKIIQNFSKTDKDNNKQLP